MNPSLVQELLEEKSPTLRILYGVATGANTVLVAGSTVAVVLPALSPVVNGDYVAVLATGADRLILGKVGGGGAWSSWSPTIVQSGLVSTSNTRSRFVRDGRTIHFTLDIVVTGTGTASNAVRPSLPVPAAAVNAIQAHGWLLDTSANLYYPAIALGNTTTDFRLLSADNSTGHVLGVDGFVAALAVDDIIRFAGTYEAAT